MSDDNLPPTGDGTPATTPPATGDGDALAADVEKWKNLARKHEQRAKENADKAAKFDAAEEAAKSEAQRLEERATRAEADLAASLLRAERAEIAAAKGVPVELLAGGSREEIEAAADALIAFKGTPPKAPPAHGQGDQGSPVGGSSEQLTRDALKSMSPAEILEAETAGRLDSLLGKTN